MVSGYYSYIKEDDDDVEYTFFSDVNDIIYNVAFEVNNYSSYLNNFPTLLQNSYSLGFRSKKFSQKPLQKDSLIFPTIYKIINDFMNDIGKEAILLYHCDTADNKQIYRNKLFNNWEKLVNETNLYKYSIETEIQKTEQSTKINYYFGFITLSKIQTWKKSNKNLILSVTLLFNQRKIDSKHFCCKNTEI